MQVEQRVFADFDGATPSGAGSVTSRACPNERGEDDAAANGSSVPFTDCGGLRQFSPQYGWFERIDRGHPVRIVSQTEGDRLRRDAGTATTRWQAEAALFQARSGSGDRQGTGELAVTLGAPRGEPVDVTVELEADPARNAQSRDERARALEAELERQRRTVGQLAPLPADPVARLTCFRLDAVEGNYPRSIAGTHHKHTYRLTSERGDETIRRLAE